MRRTRIITAAAASVAMVAAAGLAPADAAATRHAKVLAKGLVSPLRAAIAPNGTAYVSQNFTGTLVKIRRGHKPKVVYANKRGAEVGAVSIRRGVVTFATTPGGPPPERAAAGARALFTHRAAPGGSAKVMQLRHGRVRMLADVGAFERRHNPDAGRRYGVRGVSDACAAQLPEGIAPYTGIVESHPYATTSTGKKTYLADAAGNDVVAISRSGKVRKVAVLPPVTAVFTDEIAAGLGLPDCVIGHTFKGEPVPTDIERGPGGKLYVTTLGGGAGESLPVGAIYRINPRTGHVKAVLRGLSAPVGLAIRPSGRMYFSQLFSGGIFTAKAGSSKVRRFAPNPMPAEVELRDGKLYATDKALNPKGGRLVLFR